MGDIRIHGLTKRYGKSVAVDNVDLTIQDGEFLSLLGPSGCGKTTTLRCIAGLEQPDAGEIAIGGEMVNDGAGRSFVPPNRRGIGMVFQSYALWPHMSVFGNVAYPLRMQRLASAAIKPRVAEVLRLVGLERMANRGIAELSGGQQQRVAVARALVAKPRVMLLDEPLSNLDASLRTQMRRELRHLHERIRTTSVYVTHDQTEAVTLSDRVVVMNAGRIQQIGAPREIFSAPANRWVAEFVGFDNFIEARVVETYADGMRVHPRDWPTTLFCATKERPGAGGSVQLAIRSSSFVFGDTDAPNTVPASIVDATYVGDLVEYVLDAYGTRLTTRLPDVRPQSGAAFSVHVDPSRIVALAAP
jgi:iron(III) transport system ATP-binding protein